MLTKRALALTMGLAVTAASLFACASGTHHAEQPSPTISTSTDDLVVTHANTDAISERVAASHLDSMDKNRFMAFIETHRTTPSAYEGKSVRAIINLQAAYEVGERLVAQSEAQDREHRAELARLFTAEVTHAQEHDRSIDLTLALKNTTPKTVKALEFGLFVTGRDGKQIAMTEFRLGDSIGPHASRTVTVPLRYVRFGADTGAIMAAAGQPKRYTVRVKEIKYTDGSDAGYDD